MGCTPEVNKIINGERNAAGQENPNPMANFWSHSMVRIGAEIYDTSYGVIYDNINDFIDKAIDGYFVEDKVRLLNKTERSTSSTVNMHISII